MLRTEYVKCRKCGKTFKVVRGGVISTPADITDNVCSKCKKDAALKVVDKILDILG